MYTIGGIASGDDFFDRVDDQEKIWRTLEKNHILLSGPRRVGKSSLAKRLVEEAPSRDYEAHLIDLGGCASADGVLERIVKKIPQSLWQKTQHLVGGRIKGGAIHTPLGDVSVDLGWEQKLDRLEEGLSGRRLLLCLDEFSLCLSKLLEADPAAGEKFVARLRVWRQSSGGCRFIFSGSIGLNTILDRHDLQTYFNDCPEHRLGPFSRQAALDMLAALVGREGDFTAETEVLEHIRRRIGWLSPYYLNLLLHEAAERARDERQDRADKIEICLKHVDAAYDRLLSNRGAFTHWFKRLERDLEEPRRGLALKILGEVSRFGDGLAYERLRARVSGLLKKEGDFMNIIMYLEEEGYLGWGEPAAFQSFLVRDFWRRHYGD